jgi:pimeloyl-ACP methyl ester carboxylesterase
VVDCDKGGVTMITSRKFSVLAQRAATFATATWLATGCATTISPGGGEPTTRVFVGTAGRLHVNDGGKGGPPVVFVHSFAGNTTHASAQLAHLRRTRRAVAFDLRGHGRSDAPLDNDYSVSSLSADIATVVDGLGLTRFVLVGHSMGGSAAIAYAGRHPDRVAGLVMVGAPGKSPAEQATQVLTAMRANYEAVTGGYWTMLLSDARPNVEAQIRSEIGRVPRDAVIAIVAAIFAYDPLPDLRAYSGPKLIVDTQHGEGPEALHNQAPAVPREVMLGTSHWPQMDKPDEFNRILDGFLARVR